MVRRLTPLVGVVSLCVLAASFARPARADDGDLRAEVEAMRRRVEEQDRRLREFEGVALTQDEVNAAVAAYLGDGGTVDPRLVGGADGGKAGFPMGKKPFLKEGPNKLEIGIRNQVRYEAFLYGDAAKGTLSDAGNPASDAAPRDRSGFEIERLFLVLEGSVFCEDVTFMMNLNFDNDGGTGVEKNFAYLDWKYTGEHHVRAGSDKVPYCYEDNNSSSALAFVDRCLVTKAFEQSWGTGVSLWGYFGDCECPKRFFYKVAATNGEGRINKEASVFNTDAFDTFSDQLQFAGFFEWNLTCNDWKWDEVDHRPCDKRCDLNASVGIGAYYENDDDFKKDAYGGLRLGSSGRVDRYGLDAWFRAQYQGWSVVAEWMMRSLDYTRTTSGAPSTAPDQTDSGAQVTLHYRCADSNWGFGVRAGIVWLDDDYDAVTVGPVGNTTTFDLEDSITEIGFAVNYFFHDHGNKLTADVNWVQDNSGVTASTSGYLVGASKGVVIEDGVMLRLQWQINL